MAGKSASKSTKAGATQAKSLSARTRSKAAQFTKPSTTTVEVQGTQVLLHDPPTTASEQLTKTSISTVQRVDIEQSVQIMQTMLHGCLSSVVFQRSIFPPNCYETRYYINNSSQWAYNDYISARQGTIKGDGTGGSILGLKRGVSSRVDRFLDLIEIGVFDALRRGFLKSLHLSIYEEHPSDILESWTLTVHYMDAGFAGGRVPSNFDLKERTGPNITLSHVKLSLNDFIRKLTGLCLALPALPEDKKIALEMGYTNDKPPEYTAPGFPHPVYDLARFPSTDDWEKVTSDVAMICTGHHAASLRVSHLTNMNPGLSNGLPSGMECTNEVGKLDDVMVDLHERVRVVSKFGSSTKASKTGYLSSSLVQDDAVDLQLEAEHISASSPEQNPHPVATPSQTVRDLLRISSTDRQEQQQIRSMLRSPVNVSNTQVTQPAFPDRHVPVEREPAKRMTISQAKIDQVDRERSVMLPPRKEILVILTAYEHVNQIIVRCQCGHPGEEGHMILCEFCESYQHLHCYGFLGKDDPWLPDIHMCYQCLLSEEDEHLRQLYDQAIHRRALWLLRDNISFADTKSYGRILGYTAREAERLLKKFRTLGFVASNQGSSKTGMHRIVFNESEAIKTQMNQTYFDPTFGIAHHLESSAAFDGETRSTTANVHKRTREEADNDMPPSKRPLPYASGATFIDGKELNTPKSNRALQSILDKSERPVSKDATT